LIQAVQREYPSLSLERVCHLLGLSRASYYRAGQEASADPEAQALLEAIEAVVLEFAGYGYRRVTAQLQRAGWHVNHKRVLRVMREESLLCQLQRRWVRTTDSEHGLTIYPNLLKQAGWRWLTGTDQAWAADITYIRLPGGFCYLAAILDAFSRKVVGWALSEEIDASLVVAAVRQALQDRQPAAGWIHHSDRGVQYACRDYVGILQAAGARISMSGKGRPRDNAQAESFMRTLKHEEVYLQDYQSFAEAQRSLDRFITEVYNCKRLHSSLGYRPLTEFEELLAAGAL
jgi:transposase InsO family protein